jgi:hypothetical protein
MFVFPSAQLQLCVYHINSNISRTIRSKFKATTSNVNSDDLEIPDLPDGKGELTGPTDGDLLSARRAEEEADRALFGEKETKLSSSEGDMMTREAMSEAWKCVIYAPTEEKFEAQWQEMTRVYDGQRHILQYITNEYIPWKHQWASCFISRYRNFG